MSVIVARSNARCGTGSSPSTVCDYFPAVATQRALPIGSTQVVDGVSVTAFCSVKWLVTVSNAGLTRTLTYEVHATHRNGTQPTCVSYALVGDRTIRVATSAVITLGQLSIAVTSTDAEVLTVYATRLAVPMSNVIPISNSHVELKKLNTLIRAGQTGVVDFIPVEDMGMLAAFWVVSITTPTSLRQTTRVAAILSGPISGNEHGRVGDYSLTHDIMITDVIGQGIEFSIQNTSAEDYVIDATCIPIRTLGSIQACSPSPVDPRIWHPHSMVIPSGLTRSVDVVNTPTLTGATWLMSAVEDITNQAMAAELGATAPSSSTTEFCLYAIIGDYLQLDFVITSVANRLVVEITNNQLNTVTVNLLRVPTSA